MLPRWPTLMPLLLPPPCRSLQPPGLHQRGPPRWGCIPLSLQVIHTKILIARPNQTNYAVTFTCSIFIFHPPPLWPRYPLPSASPTLYRYPMPTSTSYGRYCPAMVAAVLAPTSCGRDRARRGRDRACIYQLW